MTRAAPTPNSSRQSSLQLQFVADAGRTTLRHRHAGDLRVLASLYPEAPQVCHQVLVHPPGGLVGGDVVAIAAQLGRGAHALVTDRKSVV